MDFLAHSADAKRGIPVQLYSQHISNVVTHAVRIAEMVEKYTKYKIVSYVKSIAFFHDLQKLDEQLQRFYVNPIGNPPIGHKDGGTAFFRTPEYGTAAIIPAIIISSHHGGLPNIVKETIRGEPHTEGELYGKNAFRYLKKDQHGKRTEEDPCFLDYTNKHLDEYLEAHSSLFPDSLKLINKVKNSDLEDSITQLFLRIVLSCLVDADHTDTAKHYNKYYDISVPPFCPFERLKLLDKYVEKLSNNPDKFDYDNIRKDHYAESRNCPLSPVNIIYNDAGVGSAKTVACLSHALVAAAKKGLRHIIWIAPYTAIDDQVVKVLRESIVLPGEEEDSQKVVAAHHHQADFKDASCRQLATLWNALITVTTAVQFFETLAGCMTSRLRKLHELPGSVIVVDEASFAMRPELWPQAWRWLRELSDNWGCYIILASGSMVKFWEHEDFLG